MPIYNYKAKDRAGALVEGTIEAEARAAVATRLQAMGLFPVSVEDRDAAGSFGVLGQIGRKRVRSTDLTSFYLQMSDMIGAGVPLVKALSIVKNQTTNPALAQILAQVNADVQEGATFAKALERHPRHFNNLAVALVRAGEAGGLLDQSLLRVSEYAESQDELKSKIKAALAYPLIMVALGIVAISVLMIFVMPKVMIVFEDMHQTLPLITQFVQKVSYLAANYWIEAFAALAVAFFLARRYVRTDRGAMRFHRALLKAPVLGTFLLKREVAAFTRTLGSLLRNGVPILSAIEISGEVLSLRPIREDVKKIPDSVTQGSGVAAALRESPVFPSVVVNMVAVGEETGQLPEVLLRVAHSYETQVDREVKTLTSILEPAIIVVLGVVVGFVVMAMLLPIMTIDPSKGL